MSEKTTDPFELFQISKEMLSAQQKFMPSGKIFEQMAETLRNVTQAQVAYGQALMRANAALLAALMERPLSMVADQREERPSAAAHRKDPGTP